MQRISVRIIRWFGKCWLAELENERWRETEILFEIIKPPLSSKESRFFDHAETATKWNWRVGKHGK
jgi:hypothetical protein